MLNLDMYLGERPAEIDGQPQYLCDVLLTGVFPTLVVTDARCHGSAVGISKKQLWTLFSLDQLVVFTVTAVTEFYLMLQSLGVGLVIERSLVRLPAGALSSQLGQLSLSSLRGR